MKVFNAKESTVMESNTKRRRGSVYVRILCLVDTLAPSRRGMTLEEITHGVNGMSRDTFSARTVLRDLTSMYEVGYVNRKLVNNSVGRGKLYLWTLNLNKSHHIQKVAVSVFPDGVPSHE